MRVPHTQNRDPQNRDRQTATPKAVDPHSRGSEATAPTD
jgi:hypothetical protein